MSMVWCHVHCTNNFHAFSFNCTGKIYFRFYSSPLNMMCLCVYVGFKLVRYCSVILTGTKLNSLWSWWLPFVIMKSCFNMLNGIWNLRLRYTYFILRSTKMFQRQKSNERFHSIIFQGGPRRTPRIMVIMSNYVQRHNTKCNVY